MLGGNLMKNVYFKGLDKSLNDGCYIKVFSSVMGNPFVRIERKNPDTNKEE